ncbi:HD domain-containing protein [bacterium]|nr:MAG: HD domain-containing protein [bacterium]
MQIPKEVLQIIEKLNKAKYEAFIVGGCVRDYLRNEPPKDWDITTNAHPKEIQKLFLKSFYDNQFGTVGVITDAKDETLKVVEITTYRTESKYTDKRHPDKVEFAKTIEEDLARRDFTINAVAYDPIQKKYIDPYSGKKDIKEEIICTVGNPQERFSEDALRIMRAVRFATELDFVIEPETLASIKKYAESLREIAQERIKDELVKIIMSNRAHFGIMYLQETGLLKYIMPELERGIGITQNHHHPYDCYYHGIYSLEHATTENYSLEVRIAALLHDIGKPYVKEGLGTRSTFYNHAQFGAKVAKTILKRLKFPKKFIDRVAHLVEFHLFYYETDVVTEAGVRRMLRRLGKENIKDFMEVRMCDRIGSRVPKAKPYRLRHLEYMLEKVGLDPIDPKMLKINGNEIMKVLKIEPSRRVGLLLEALLQEVLDNPKNNTKDYLNKRIKELHKIKDKELEKKAAKVYQFKQEKDAEIKAKYWVK